MTFVRLDMSSLQGKTLTGDESSDDGNDHPADQPTASAGFSSVKGKQCVNSTNISLFSHLHQPYSSMMLVCVDCAVLLSAQFLSSQPE